jgi:uncharacterized protein (DUF1810 family)
MSSLERFRTAQNSSDSGFATALAEIRAGHKRGHWIWYVFPQLKGLGASAYSQTFGIDGEREAVAYLHDSELRQRLTTIATAVADRLRSGNGASLAALMGSDVDALKLVSSMTLFRHVATKLGAAEEVDSYQELASAADSILKAAASQGYAPCAFTIRQLQRGHSLDYP